MRNLITSIIGLVIVLSMITASAGTAFAQQKNVTLDNAETVNITATNAEFNGEQVPLLQLIINVNSIPGPTGPAGINGTNGLDGAPGPIGPQGIQGEPGPAGKDGQNGTIIIDVPQIENATDSTGNITDGGNVTEPITPPTPEPQPTPGPIEGNVTDDKGGNDSVTDPIQPVVPIGNITEPITIVSDSGVGNNNNDEDDNDNDNKNNNNDDE